MSLIRRRHFTEIEIIAFVGGLLGLFLGFSMLSFVEIFYFFGIHPVIKKFSKGVSNMPKTKSKSSTWHNVKTYLIEYLQGSTIHSFNFIGDANKHFIERIAWLLAFALSLTGCTFMVLDLFNNLNINAISMVTEDGIHEVSKIPFPAVTIFGSYPVPVYYDKYLFALTTNDAKRYFYSATDFNSIDAVQ